MVAAACGTLTAAAVQAMAILLAPKQTQAQWQQQRKAQRSKQNQKQSQQNQRQNQQQAAIGVEKLAYHCHFTVSGPGLDTAGTATQVADRVIGRVEGGAGVAVVDAVRLGPAASPRFLFKVATVEQAEVLIRGRGPGRLRDRPLRNSQRSGVRTPQAPLPRLPPPQGSRAPGPVPPHSLGCRRAGRS